MTPIDNNEKNKDAQGGVCRRCGRKLKNPALTIGPICSKKIQQEEHTLEELLQAKLQTIEETKTQCPP